MSPLLLTLALVGQITTDYNDVRNDSAEYMTLRGVVAILPNDLTIDIQLSNHFDGQSRPALTENDDVRMMIASSSDTWQFLKYSTTVVNIDGRITRMEPRSISRDVKDGGVTEYFHHKMTVARMREFADGENVAIAIGGTNMRLRDSDKKQIREFLDHVTKSTDELKAEEERIAKGKAAQMAKQKKKDDVENAKREEVKRDKGAQSDIQMAKNFIKLGKVKSAKEYIEKALNRNPSEDIRKEAEGILETLEKGNAKD